MIWSTVPVHVVQHSGKWSTIPVTSKNWTTSHRNSGPDPTGIADHFPPESVDQLRRNPHLAKQFSWDKLVAVVVPMIAKIVDLHNALGLFQKPVQTKTA